MNIAAMAVPVLIEQLNRATDRAKARDTAIRALITKWQADADLCDEAGIESPTMPIRAAVAELRAVLGEGG